MSPILVTAKDVSSEREKARLNVILKHHFLTLSKYHITDPHKISFFPLMDFLLKISYIIGTHIKSST